MRSQKANSMSEFVQLIGIRDLLMGIDSCQSHGRRPRLSPSRQPGGMALLGGNDGWLARHGLRLSFQPVG